MAIGITVHLADGDPRRFPDADRVERMVDAGNRWSLSVGSLAVFKLNELQKAFKSADWRWYERHVDQEPQPLQHVLVPRRDGDTTRIPGNRWALVETVEDSRGPYHSWVIYRDKEVRAVFRHAEVALDRSLWAREAGA